MCQGLFCPLAQVRERDRRAGLEHDGGDDVLAALAGGDTHGSHVEDAGHRAHRIFDLRGIDVEAGGVDHLLASVRHVDKAVAHLDQVARAQPAVGGEHLRGLLVLIPVPGEDLRAGCDELADRAVLDVARGVLGVDDAHPRGGEGNTQRPARPRGGQGGTEEDRGCLGHAVAFDHEAPGRLLPLVGQRRRQGHRARQGEVDGGQVHVRALGCRQQALVHGGHAQEERAGESALGGQDQRSVELREHGDGRPQAQGRQETDREAEGVEEGQDAVEDLGALVQDRHPRDRLLDVGAQVGVRESRRLGHARRAARVDEQGNVVHGGGALPVPGRRGTHCPRPGASPSGTRARELFALGARRLQGEPERHSRGRGKRRRQVHREGGVPAPEERQFLQGLRPGDGDACAVALILALQLAGGCERVVFDDDGAEQHRSEDRDRVLRAVGHDEGDAVAGAHARLMECARAATHLFGQLGVGELAREKVDGGAPRVTGGDLQDHLRDWLGGGGDLVGNSGRVERA